MRRNNIALTLLTCACALVITPWAPAASITMAPLATWSPNGDGWLAPAEGGYTFLGTGNLVSEDVDLVSNFREISELLSLNLFEYCPRLDVSGLVIKSQF